MGKRKSSKKAPPKPSTTPLSSTFKCLFCHHDKSVNVKLDKQTMFGHLNCKTCGQRYQAPINNLSAAVDVYCDWVDACEEIRLKQPKKQRAPRGPDPLLHGAQGGATFSLTDRAHPHGAADDELDAEGEDDEDDEGEDLAGMLNKEKVRRKAVDDDDDDLDADDRDADRGKRRRVADYDDDDDDE